MPQLEKETQELDTDSIIVYPQSEEGCTKLGEPTPMFRKTCLHTAPNMLSNGLPHA